jgi:hypothetical protein
MSQRTVFYKWAKSWARPNNILRSPDPLAFFQDVLPSGRRLPPRTPPRTEIPRSHLGRRHGHLRRHQRLSATPAAEAAGGTGAEGSPRGGEGPGAGGGVPRLDGVDGRVTRPRRLGPQPWRRSSPANPPRSTRWSPAASAVVPSPAEPVHPSTGFEIKFTV